MVKNGCWHCKGSHYRIGFGSVIRSDTRQASRVPGTAFFCNPATGVDHISFFYITWIRPEEWEIASQILGSRFIETEVSAYFSLASIQATDSALTIRSMTIMTYALCGFIHISSMGIFVGGLSALVPSRAHEISIIGLQALWTSFLAKLLTGYIAGSLVLI